MWAARRLSAARHARAFVQDLDPAGDQPDAVPLPAAPAGAPLELDPPQIDLDAPEDVPAEPHPAPRPVVAAHVRAVLEECTVDGKLVYVGDNSAGKFYLFTVPWPLPGSPWKSPEEIGREGLHLALVAVYGRVFPAAHPCHGGPSYGAVARELHRLSPVYGLRRPHLHEATAFPAEHRWKAVEQRLRSEQRINVHISKHQCYRTMFDYLTQPTERKPFAELDNQLWRTPGHPEPENIPLPPPHLVAAWRARAQDAPQGREAVRPPREEHFTLMQFYDLLKQKRVTLKTEEDVWAYARDLEEHGDKKLVTFLFHRRDLPQVLERFEKAWNAPAAVQRRAMTRREVLCDAASKPCTCAAHGLWHTAANEVTRASGYEEQEVECAVLEALELGRAKRRNVMIVGDTNRAKSFVLKPVEIVYNVYKPPESGSHQLADIRGAEVIWLNDFTYERDFMPWRAFKDFLEGSSVKVAVPKTLGTNYMFDADSPVLATAPGPVTWPGRPSETAQMTTRWRYFLFTEFYDPDTCPDIPPCGSCWAQWLLAAADRERRPPGPPPVGIWSTAAAQQPVTCSNAARRNAKRARTWHLQKEPGTYTDSDLPGLCFFCGAADHRCAECPVKSSQEERGPVPAASSATDRCGACLAPLPDSQEAPCCLLCGTPKT